MEESGAARHNQQGSSRRLRHMRAMHCSSRPPSIKQQGSWRTPTPVGLTGCKRLLKCRRCTPVLRQVRVVAAAPAQVARQGRAAALQRNQLIDGALRPLQQLRRVHARLRRQIEQARAPARQAVVQNQGQALQVGCAQAAVKAGGRLAPLRLGSRLRQAPRVAENVPKVCQSGPVQPQLGLAAVASVQRGVGARNLCQHGHEPQRIAVAGRRQALRLGELHE